MTLAPADLYHSGDLVEDIEDCIARLSRAGISRWTPPKEHALRIRVEDDETTARFRYVYSADGPHRIELIQSLEDGYLRSTGPLTFHHLGFWVDDLEMSVAASTAWGLTLECTFLNGDGSPKVTYHVDAGGTRYEMVPLAQQPLMEQRWALARGE